MNGRGEYGTRVGQQTHPIVRVPVIDPDGKATTLLAVWVLPGVVPSYFWETPIDDVWLFEDPSGEVYVDPTRVAAGSPIAGRRFRPYYAVTRPTITGDRPTSRRQPTLPPEPPVTDHPYGRGAVAGADPTEDVRSTYKVGLGGTVAVVGVLVAGALLSARAKRRLEVRP